MNCGEVAANRSTAALVNGVSGMRTPARDSRRVIVAITELLSACLMPSLSQQMAGMIAYSDAFAARQTASTMAALPVAGRGPFYRRLHRMPYGGAPFGTCATQRFPMTSSTDGVAGSKAATGWGAKVDRRTNRHNAGWVDLTVAHIVVALDVHKIHRRGDAGPLVELARIGPKVGIIDQSPDVTFEVAIIDGIETDKRGEEPPIGFGRLLSD